MLPDKKIQPSDDSDDPKQHEELPMDATDADIMDEVWAELAAEKAAENGAE